MEAHELPGREHEITTECISLLKQLIEIPSFSKHENQTAELLAAFLQKKGFSPLRKGNNVWAISLSTIAKAPVILLNSHHDTVKPNAGYTHNPFYAFEKDGKLFGLGSNDAGGPLVSLLATFICFSQWKERPFTLIFAGTAEEEISGPGGIVSLLDELGPIDLAIVGEPTQMQMAIAEKGLLVLDCITKGRAGHAARNEGINAIQLAVDDIQWFHSYSFPECSELLGPIKMSVTLIEAGKQHNVVPDECRYTVDVRTTDAYSNEETLAIIRQHVKAEVNERSLRLRPSGISLNHPIVLAGQKIGMEIMGSSTLSDQALMPFPSVKIGPGDSARSHTADEYIYLHEIQDAVTGYINLLSQLSFEKK